MDDSRRTRLQHFLLALVPPLVAALLEWLAWPLITPYPWPLFFPAIFVSAWIGGLTGGLAATVLSVTLVEFIFVPEPRLGFDDTPTLLAVGTILVASGVLFSIFHGRLRRARQLAATALATARDSERRLRELLQQAPDGIFIADIDGRYTAVNDAGCRMLGYRPEEIIGQSIFDLIPPEDADRLTASKARMLAGKTDVDQWTLRRKDGGYLPVEVSAAILPDGRWQGFARDISERVRLERALREGHADLEQAQAVAKVGSWRLDLVANRLYWSKEAYRIFGISEGTPMDYAAFLARVHPDDRQYVDRQWRAALAGAPYDIEHRLLVNGEVIWVRETADLERGADGQAIGGIGVTQDITEQKLAEQALEDSEERLRLLLESAPEGVIGVDTDGVCTFINPAGLRLLGYDAPEELIGKRIHPLIHHTRADGEPCLEDECQVYAAFRKEHGFEVDQDRFWRADGTSFPTEYHSYPILRNGRTEGAVAIFSDITARQQAEEQLRQAAIVFDNTAEAVIVTDAERRIVRVNRAYTEITGYLPDEAIGRDPLMHRSGRHDDAFYARMWKSLNEAGQWQGEIWNRRKNGEIYPAWQNISAVRDSHGRLTHYVAVLSDITTIKQAEERLSHLAHHDTLTGLPNRLLFGASLKQALERAKRHDQRVALLFLDLDRFKLINDSLGHAAGDRLLQTVAGRLRQSVRGEDVVARLGGDEFTVIVEEVGDPDDTTPLARKLIETVARPIDVNGKEVQTSASIGIALFPDDAANADDLAKAADAAMYRAKLRGRNTFEFYTPEITALALEHLSIERGLRQALARGELELYYQPQIDLASNRLVGLEALVRWNHPAEGLLMPARFIAIAEESDLIEQVGDWVLRQACTQAANWAAEGLRPPRIGVNLSGRQVQYDHVVETASTALAACRGNGPIRIELEVTESVLLSMSEGADTLHRLRALGVGIAIDDFGTGYSSLSLLKHLPIDTLKIDQIFLRNIPEDSDNRAIASAMISMAHDLGLRVVAEGVETEGQLAFMREQGCDEVQGYLIGEPVPAGIIAARLEGAPDGRHWLQ